tara:strand:- start:3740 stop:4177 length:438 start_codon:yes stop_codon:yes gene_type:complete
VSYNKNKQDTIFSTVTTQLGDELTWRWEDKQAVLLTEFSWEKKERILTILRRLFSDEWQKKNIKQAPIALKDELAELAKLSKKQLIFTKPATEDTPAIAVIWWPWGHGATYSMRIKILTSNYDDAALERGKASLFTKVIQRIKSR